MGDATLSPGGNKGLRFIAQTANYPDLGALDVRLSELQSEYPRMNPCYVERNDGVVLAVRCFKFHSNRIGTLLLDNTRGWLLRYTNQGLQRTDVKEALPGAKGPVLPSSACNGALDDMEQGASSASASPPELALVPHRGRLQVGSGLCEITNPQFAELASGGPLESYALETPVHAQADAAPGALGFARAARSSPDDSATYESWEFSPFDSSQAAAATLTSNLVDAAVTRAHQASLEIHCDLILSNPELASVLCMAERDMEEAVNVADNRAFGEGINVSLKPTARQVRLQDLIGTRTDALSRIRKRCVARKEEGLSTTDILLMGQLPTSAPVRPPAHLEPADVAFALGESKVRFAIPVRAAVGLAGGHDKVLTRIATCDFSYSELGTSLEKVLRGSAP